MRKSLLLFILFCSLLFQPLWAQERTVSGKITDEKGESLPGVNVVVKGTTTGTVTDIDGNYRITVSDDQTVLIYTFIGYATQEIEIGVRSVIDVQLASGVTELSEVVVTAQGIAREAKSIGYSVVSVGNDKIERKAEPDVLRALQGKVPGVEIIDANGAPGSATQITIRGFTSTGNNQPLIVVDGVPFNNSSLQSVNPLVGGAPVGNRLGDINPSDIAEINVLKGASASVLYGTRAANGVILITTKSGSAKEQGIKISLSTSYNTEEVIRLPDYQNIYGQGGEGVINTGFFSSFGPRFSDNLTQPAFYSDASFAEIFPERIGTTVPYQAFEDNIEDFYQQGFLIDNAVNVSGGNELGSFFTSFARTDQEGFVPNSEFERTTFSAGGNYKFANGWSFGGTLNYSQSEQQSFITGGGAGGTASLHQQLWFIPRSFDLNGLPSTNPLNGDQVYYLSNRDNPVWQADNNIFTSTVRRSYGNVNIGYEVNDWLSVSYKYGFNSFNNVAVDFVERSSLVDQATFQQNGGLTRTDTRNDEFNSDFLVTIKRNLTDEISLTANVGQNINIRNSEIQSVVGQSLVVPGIRDLDNTNTLLPNGIGPFVGGGISTRRIIGVFADLAFSYKDYLFLNYQARNDWSSTLPEGQRGFFYTGASASFVFTEALNLQNDVFNYGKLRVGFGRVGTDPGVFATSQVFASNPTFGNNIGNVAFPFGGTPGVINGQSLVNPDIEPEFTNEFEVGTDLAFLNGRINLDFTYYNRVTDNLLINRTLPSSTGFLLQLDNVGELTNRGFEIGLGITPVDVNGFSWTLYNAFTRNVSEVESLAPGQESLSIGFGFTGDFGAFLIPGEQFGVIQGSAFARDDEGNILVDGSTGFPISANDVEIIADPNREFQWGFTNTFEYKGINLSILVDWLEGGEYHSNTATQLVGRGVTTNTTDVDREIPRIYNGVLGDPNTAEPILDEDGNTIPNTTVITSNQFYFNSLFSSAPSEANVFDATTIQLREITLSYSLPNSLIENTFLKGVTVSLTGRNLAFWAPGLPRGSAINPSNQGGQLGNVRGFDFDYVPQIRRYGFNVKFDL